MFELLAGAPSIVVLGDTANANKLRHAAVVRQPAGALLLKGFVTSLSSPRSFPHQSSLCRVYRLLLTTRPSATPSQFEALASASARMYRRMYRTCICAGDWFLCSSSMPSARAARGICFVFSSMAVSYDGCAVPQSATFTHIFNLTDSPQTRPGDPPPGPFSPITTPPNS